MKHIIFTKEKTLIVVFATGLAYESFDKHQSVFANEHNHSHISYSNFDNTAVSSISGDGTNYQGYTVKF